GEGSTGLPAAPKWRWAQDRWSLGEGGSCEVVLRLAHQLDEHVLQGGLHLAPPEGRLPPRRDGGLQRAAVGPGDVDGGAEGGDGLDARLALELVGQLADVGPLAVESDQVR